MLELKQTEVFRKWRTRLKDERARAVIASRLGPACLWACRCVSPVGEGVSELRIHYGPGYRIYFQKRGKVVIVLLCGGDKSTQAGDIRKAKRLVDEWSE